ncbi:hypothetical protein [Burkholderia lata]|uniref:hypothetical protein n=1 Tax=Burkholderia lata (strain ATCC 17760 / DSM 23089 / LMG 22485 / NCIMB 9086 / R18194 / 383) TaxID=482957 RepID=UPI0015838A40|nr:hypothetical protein [Burkholderia lata]
MRLPRDRRENDRRKKTGPQAGFFQLTLRLTGLRPKPEQPSLPKQPTPLQQQRRSQQPLPTKQQPKRRSQHQQLPKQPSKQQQPRRLQPTKQLDQRSCCKQPVQQQPTGKLRGGISS